ncbi:tyrosine-type recombinase/integrase [Ascidiaceihabitans sp.]|nr:tyrosine-type recombinase/integrase [Ascidiaceihabitans sp.]
MSNVIEREGIEKLSPHCLRHSFVTSMLQAGIRPKFVAIHGGWKDVGTVMKFYAHAMYDPTDVDVIFGTK